MAKRKIVISEYDNIAALMEDDRAVEFIIHRGDMLLGDVYLCTVENILPSIDAAFVNVGGDKMGFLHSSDVPGKGDLKDRLEPKQQLVVQIMKEPTGHKGPRVSTNISLPGRFLVMMPESKGISISRKIVETAERSRLKSIVSLIKPPGVGVIIRTEAESQKESDITEDFETLLERWQNIVSMADTAAPPTLLYRDQDLLYRVIREAVTEDVQEIVVDSAFGQQRAQQLLQNWNMDKGVKVTHYQGSQPILVGSGVDKEIKLALNTKVPLPSGGYLYIQPTEALCVVDVNSGKFTSLASQAETIKLTNLEACKEIARQLRLRNIGGMIIVDFIDMESRANQLQVLQTFENELAPDKAKPQIGQLSDLGLVEMTRHRQGQSLSEIFTRRCQTCMGTGHALDELAWMHGGEDSRRKGDRGGKLPMRQAGRGQPLPKPAASINKRGDRGGRIAAQITEGGRQDRPGPQSTVTPGNILLSTLTEKKQPAGKPAEPETTLSEYFADRIYKAMGAKLSNVVKLAWMPMGINSVLSRINPKANDIVTLVHSIEAAASMPIPMGRGYDAFADEEDGLDFDVDETEEIPAEVRERGKPAFAQRPQPLPNGRGRGAIAPGDEDALQEVLPLAVADEDAEEVDSERPRRGRGGRRGESATAGVSKMAEFDDTEDDLTGLATDIPELGSEELQEVALDRSDEGPLPGEDEDVIAEDVDTGSDEEEEGSEESEAEAGGAVAVANAGKPPRRRGRPPKRSLKKPPAKR